MITAAPSLFPNSMQTFGVGFEDVGPLLVGHKACECYDTEYWYRYAWEQIAAAGLTKITDENPLELIAIHAATLAQITEEFQSIVMGVDYECDYSSFEKDFMPVHQLAQVYQRFFAGKAKWIAPEDSKAALRELVETTIDGNRERIVEALGAKTDPETFVALFAATEFPSTFYSELADQIESEYPLDMSDCREKDDFSSYEEYAKFIGSEDGRAEILSNMDDNTATGKRKAYDWLMSGALSYNNRDYRSC